MFVSTVSLFWWNKNVCCLCVHLALINSEIYMALYSKVSAFKVHLYPHKTIEERLQIVVLFFHFNTICQFFVVILQ